MFVSRKRLSFTKGESFKHNCQLIAASAAAKQLPYEILVARLRTYTAIVLLRWQSARHAENFIKRNHAEVDRIWKSAIGGDFMRALDADPAAVAFRLAGMPITQVPVGMAAPHLLDNPVESPIVLDLKEGTDFQAV